LLVQPINSAQEETMSVEGNEQKGKNFNSDFCVRLLHWSTVQRGESAKQGTTLISFSWNRRFTRGMCAWLCVRVMCFNV